MQGTVIVIVGTLIVVSGSDHTPFFVRFDTLNEDLPSF